MKLLVTLLFISTSAWSYFDFSVNYNYSKSVINASDDETLENEEGQAINTTEGVTVGLGWFIWAYTAIELSYSSSTNKVIDDRSPEALGSDITLLSVKNTIKNEVKGIGIRQAFAGRNARFIPSISIGYAEFTTSGVTTYYIDTAGTISELDIEQEAQTQNSSYASVSLRIKITQFMGLNLMARSVMPEFETERINDNMTYSAGFSWVF